MVMVRIVDGPVSGTDVLVDGEWPCAPVEGQEIAVASTRIVYQVNAVRYIVGPDDELIGVVAGATVKAGGTSVEEWISSYSS